MLEALGFAQLAQHGFQLHAGDDALAHLDLPIAQTNLGRKEDVVVVLLAAHGQFLARRLLLEQQLGGDTAEDHVHLRQCGAGGIGRAHQRAHAGTGDAVHRHAVFLQHSQHTDMSGAAGTTAGQHQTDARTLASIISRRVAGSRRGRGQGSAGEQPQGKKTGHAGHDWPWCVQGWRIRRENSGESPAAWALSLIRASRCSSAKGRWPSCRRPCS